MILQYVSNTGIQDFNWVFQHALHNCMLKATLLCSIKKQTVFLFFQNFALNCVYWLGKFFFLLGFIMSKNPKGLWLNLLIKTLVCNLSCFFDIINPGGKRIYRLNKLSYLTPSLVESSSTSTHLTDLTFSCYNIYWVSNCKSLTYHII